MMSSEEKGQWLAERAGKLTASRMDDAMAFLKDGKTPSAVRSKYMRELLAERLTGFSVPHLVNGVMEHGLEFEDEAVDVFVERWPQYNPVLSRFYEHPIIANFGATPDREIGNDGLLEVKCPTSVTFVEWSLAGVIPEKHKPQMCAQLMCTGRSWCGFVAYDPRIKEEKRRLYVRKYVPTPEEIAGIEAAAIKFLSELDAMFDAFTRTAA